MTDVLHLPLITKFSTRILSIHPDVKWQPIRASLLQVDCRDHPRYEALSYTWGPVGDEREITVDGIKVPIRYNLWCFLQRIRRHDVVRTVWVDAICISQIDLVEKAAQVRIIGPIFANATRVVVWVGEHADGSKKLFGSRNLRESLEWFIQPLSSRISASVPKQGEMPMWHVWRMFLNRPYFKRTWIVQEIACAKELIVHCGDHIGDWDHLVWSRIRAKDAYDNYSIDGTRVRQNQVAAIEHIALLDKTRMQWQRESRLLPHMRETSNGISTFVMLVQAHQDTECEDRRDKVYALLSLGPRGLDIHPDCSISVADLFLDMCERILDEGYWWYDLGVLFSSMSLERKELAYILEVLLDSPVEQSFRVTGREGTKRFTSEQTTNLLDWTIRYGLRRLELVTSDADHRSFGPDAIRVKAREVLHLLRDIPQTQVPVGSEPHRDAVGQPTD